MRGSATTLLVVLLLWLAGSAWWYTCKIKDNCISIPGRTKTVSSTMVIDLEGFEPQTFHLKNSSNGIMEFMPGSNSDGLNVIKEFLSQNPGRSIDLVTANESQANGLLAMLILSGVPNRRINAYTDPTVGSAEKPLKIMSAPVNEATYNHESTTDSVSVVETAKKPEASTFVDQNNTAPARVYPVLPCPDVITEGGLPRISDILYPSASYEVRCVNTLNNFAEFAGLWLKDDPNISIVITGHTDDNQNMTNNYQLALKRAVEVKKYLIKQGIPGNRIETYSKGADVPVADNSSENGQQSNRRVSISWNF